MLGIRIIIIRSKIKPSSAQGIINQKPAEFIKDKKKRRKEKEKKTKRPHTGPADAGTLVLVVDKLYDNSFVS